MVRNCNNTIYEYSYLNTNFKKISYLVPPNIIILSPCMTQHCLRRLHGTRPWHVTSCHSNVDRLSLCMSLKCLSLLWLNPPNTHRWLSCNTVGQIYGKKDCEKIYHKDHFIIIMTIIMVIITTVLRIEVIQN